MKVNGVKFPITRKYPLTSCRKPKFLHLNLFM